MGKVTGVTVAKFLKARNVPHHLLTYEQAGDTLEHVAGAVSANPSHFARVMPVEVEGTHGHQFALTILPLNHIIDWDKLNADGRHYALVDTEQFKKVFPVANKSCIPPITSMFEVMDFPVYVSSSLANLERVYFASGDDNEVLVVSGQDFVSLQRLPEVFDFTTSLKDASSEQAIDAIKKRIETLYDLPVMPEIAHKILELRQNEDADIKDLVEVVQMDPSLAAQVIRYARSPFFGYRGKVDSIEDAIVRVLGYESVMNMALALAAGRAFNYPIEGPLGRLEFWKHATYCAALTQALVKKMPVERRPKPGMAYLSGLLHNFGFLLLSHIFRPEFTLLNKMLAAKPQSKISDLEHNLIGLGNAKAFLGLGHTFIGSWLMEHWNMPEELIVVTREHHNPDYEGDYAVYANLIMLSNELLKQHGIGEAEDDTPHANLIEQLGLTAEICEQTLERLLESRERIDAIAEQFAA